MGHQVAATWNKALTDALQEIHRCNYWNIHSQKSLIVCTRQQIFFELFLVFLSRDILHSNAYLHI